MIMCVLLCYPVSIRIYYQQGGLFLVFPIFGKFLFIPIFQDNSYFFLFFVKIMYFNTLSFVDHMEND